MSIKPLAYVLEFEKPLRELARQLDELRQQSIETNVDLAHEILLI
jgi:acetyl-CoA carboxylase carboxyl transferase subunit alpha